MTTWRVVFAASVPDFNGRVEPQSILLVDRDQGDLEQALGRAYQRVRGEGHAYEQLKDARFVGVYAE